MRLTKQIGAKLRNASGVSMVLALGIMMVVSIVCVSTLKVASSAPRAAYAQQDLEQSYLAATSAAKLVKHIFDTDEAKSLRLLQEMDKCSANNGLDSGFSKEFQVQLNRTGVDATILNKFNMAKVTLTKTSDGTVTVSVSGSGYPASLSLPVDTIVWQNADGTERAKTTYPKNYSGTPTPPADYDSGGFPYTYSTSSGLQTGSGGNTYVPTRMWKVIWINKSGTFVDSANSASEPETMPISSSGTSGDSDFKEWDWTHKGTDNDNMTIIVPPVFLSTASGYYDYRAAWTEAPTVTYSTASGGSYNIAPIPAYKPFALQTYTIKWMDGDSTTILDEKTATANQLEPETEKTPVKGDENGFFYCTGWDDGSMDGTTKTYAPQFEETASITAKTVKWLDGNETTVLETKYYPEGGTEPTTDKTPTKAADDTHSYTFEKWDSGTVEGNVKTYKPKFTSTPLSSPDTSDNPEEGGGNDEQTP